MVDEPEKWVKDFSEAGCSQYCFHIEAASKKNNNLIFNNCIEDPSKLIDEIKKANMLAGIAVKPKTDISSVFPYLDQVNLILVMVFA